MGKLTIRFQDSKGVTWENTAPTREEADRFASNMCKNIANLTAEVFSGTGRQLSIFGGFQKN